MGEPWLPLWSGGEFFIYCFYSIYLYLFASFLTLFLPRFLVTCHSSATMWEWHLALTGEWGKLLNEGEVSLWLKSPCLGDIIFQLNGCPVWGYYVKPLLPCWDSSWISIRSGDLPWCWLMLLLPSKNPSSCHSSFGGLALLSFISPFSLSFPSPVCLQPLPLPHWLSHD